MSITKEKNDLYKFNKYESADVLEELLYDLGIEASDRQLESVRNGIKSAINTNNKTVQNDGIPPHRYFNLQDKYEQLLDKHNKLTKKYDSLYKEMYDSKLVKVTPVENDLLMLISNGHFYQKLEENRIYVRMRVGEILTRNNIVKTQGNYYQIINTLLYKGLIQDASEKNIGNNSKQKIGHKFVLSGKQYRLED
ncbi:MAG: hypothetical protein HRS57_03145 [Mycoplasmataceae bacterium]|nr:hypothetical protein [Mycoplasmataceae bacterium]